MDSDIAIISEPGLGSLFTVRIPLFNIQFPIQQDSDIWRGKTLWLNIRNQSRLEIFLMEILGGYGAMMVLRHEEKQVATSDVMIGDHPIK